MSLLLRQFCPPLANKPLHLPLSNKCFDLLLQVIIIDHVMAMVTVKYLSLDLLLGSPFSLPGKVRAPLSLIYIKTWLIGVVSGVKFVNFRMGGLAGPSSRRSSVLAIFSPLS